MRMTDVQMCSIDCADLEKHMEHELGFNKDNGGFVATKIIQQDPAVIVVEVVQCYPDGSDSTDKAVWDRNSKGWRS